MRRPRQAYGRRRSGGLLGGLGGRFKIVLVALVGLAAYWFSNQQTVPFSDRSRLLTVSIDDASALGEQSYVQILQGEPGGVLCETTSCGPVEAEIVSKVRKIGRDLQRAAVQLENELLQEGYRFEPVSEKFNWQYNVVPSEQPNAFCLPGGYVAVYTQIMDVAGDNDGVFEPDDDLRDLDMLAVIMGHEIGHALAHHGAERMSQQKVAHGDCSTARRYGSLWVCSLGRTEQILA